VDISSPPCWTATAGWARPPPWSWPTRTTPMTRTWLARWRRARHGLPAPARGAGPARLAAAAVWGRDRQAQWSSFPGPASDFRTATSSRRPCGAGWWLEATGPASSSGPGHPGAPAAFGGSEAQDDAYLAHPLPHQPGRRRHGPGRVLPPAPGAVVSTAIDKYMYVTVQPLFRRQHHLSTAAPSLVRVRWGEIRHPILPRVACP